ncbi:hypothetical protein P5V15_000646 [Pogonomyrmex californicus]
MEEIRTGTMHNTKSSSIVSCVDRTDIDELSKEKEEELLFGAEEEGDDEDALSDDSLRLRLSDDDDVEQEDITTNDANVLETKSQIKKIEQSSDVIAEEILCSDSQRTAEESTKLDSEEPVQKEHNIAISENSALPLDEYISENEQIQDNIDNLENTNTNINEFNEKFTFKSSKNSKIIEISDECSSIIFEQHVELKNDTLLTNNHVQTNNPRNAKLIIHTEENSKKATIDTKEIISTNTCELNNLENAGDNSVCIDSDNTTICKSEKLSTTATVSDSNDDSLGNETDKKINRSLKNCSPVELINDLDYVDLVKSGNSNDLLFYKDTIKHDNKNKNIEPMNVIENKNVSQISRFTEKKTSLSVENQINLPNVKDNIKITSKNRDADKIIIENVNNMPILQNILLISSDVDSNNENGIKNVDTIIPRRKRYKKTIDTVQNCAEEDKQEKKESGRQKRKTAKNAEELIRKRYLNSGSDSSDSAERIVTGIKKVKQGISTLSPSLKRNCMEKEVLNGNIKKTKMNTNSEENNDITQLSFVEKFFRRDSKGELPKLTQEELEELLIQKIVETIAMRSEIGQLREQARISERYQEVTRVKLQQLMKQVKDFEMVLNRNAIDRRANPDKTIAPIKINRSVGLQVNFITEHGIQNLRQVQQTMLKPAANPSSSGSSSSVEANNNVANSKRSGIKTRSPRSIATTTTAPTVTQNQSVPMPPLIPTVTPAALVVAKPLESPHTLTLSNQPASIINKPILPAPQQQIQTQPHQAIVLNGKIQNQVNRPTPIAPKPRSSDLIDLTDEEEKNKSNVKVTTTTTAMIEQQLNATKSGQFQRVIQTIPTNVAITTQPTSIKVITSNQQSTPTLVSNMNPPRLAYLMPSTTGSPRQVLIASNTNQQVQIRPVATSPMNSNRPQFSSVNYKTGIQTLANGPVRVITTPVLSNIQISKHPAPLPDTPNYATTPGWKLPPPAPSLKISKVSNGIVLSWNMNLTDKYADIASYQLYAYQEVAGMNPSTSLWKKVGDVRALPLPMACTLTQFSEGNNYYFAVRAVDTHSRKGQYSIPGNISL